MSDELGLSLWKIDETLHELVLMREEAQTDDERAVIDGQIQVWMEAEVRKVDRVRGYLKHCAMMQAAAEAEAKEQRARAEMWDNRARRLKDMCLEIMERSGAKRLDGATGALRRQANGGKRALRITRAALIPEEYFVYRGMIRSNAWGWLRSQLGQSLWEKWSGRQDVQMDRVPLEDAVRTELERCCVDCNGYGTKDGERNGQQCETCAGTGHQLVPGAELLPRGEHVRVE